MTSPQTRLVGEVDPDIEYEFIDLNELRQTACLPKLEANKRKRPTASTLRKLNQNEDTTIENQSFNSSIDIFRFLPDNSNENDDSIMELLESNHIKINTPIPLALVYKFAPESIPADLLVLKQIARLRLEILQFLFQCSWTELMDANRRKLCA